MKQKNNVEQKMGVDMEANKPNPAGWTKEYIEHVMADLMAENTLACRALFRITEMRFTGDVETLAVSISDRSVLHINPDFLDEYAQSEQDIKTLLMHEFLHVLLNHTLKYKRNTPLLNVALDAVINSMIHRMMGEDYSSFFDWFYQGDGLEALLRPGFHGLMDGRERLTDMFREDAGGVGAEGVGAGGSSAGGAGDAGAGAEIAGAGAAGADPINPKTLPEKGAGGKGSGRKGAGRKDTGRKRDMSGMDGLGKDLRAIHKQVYAGELSADDLYQWLRNRLLGHIPEITIVFLGNHAGGANSSSEQGEGAGQTESAGEGEGEGADQSTGQSQAAEGAGIGSEEMSEEIRKILQEAREALKQQGKLDGGKGRGRGGAAEQMEQEVSKQQLYVWKKETRAVLQKCLVKDRTRMQLRESVTPLPMLHPRDRRAYAAMRMSPFLPFSRVPVQKRSPKELAAVYLDVSGSMMSELDALISLFHHFRDELRRPFYVFSDDVAPARFVGGTLEYVTSGGTSIGPVFEHIRANRIQRALIVTDGFVERITPEMMSGLRADQIQVLLSSFGLGGVFKKAGIQTHTLPKLPQMNEVSGRHNIPNVSKPAGWG